MATGPTQNSELAAPTGWNASPRIAWIIRAVAFLIPLLGAWLVVRLVSPAFFRPAGWVGLAAWGAQALVVALVASRVIETFSRRLLPLAALFNMSLVFPDQAPSRFGLALRSGSVGRLTRRTADPARAGQSAQEFAEEAVAMVAQLSRHDRITRGHSERVRAYADLIAEEMDLPTEDRVRLSWAALLHDLGKIRVASEILNKDGRPTDAEWRSLAKHPEHAEELLAPLADWLGPWIGAATQHHERWDGEGYPAGLGGIRISMAGRITAVADAYDTMTSSRSYKKAVSPEAARQELVASSGTQFDPDVVRAFLNVSLGRRWAGGPLASLAELAGLWSVSGSAVPAVASSVIVVGTLGVGAPANLSTVAPAGLSFVETFTAPTETSIASLSFVEAPQDDSDDQAPSEKKDLAETLTSSTAVPSVTTESTVSLAATTQRPPSTSVQPPTTTPSTTTTPSSTSSTTTPAPSTSTTTAPTTTTTAPPQSMVVSDDEVEVEQHRLVRIFVLENDESKGSEIDWTTLTIVTDPTNHKLLGIEDDRIHYKPRRTFVGSDTLEYGVCNFAGQCDTGWVTITVLPR